MEDNAMFQNVQLLIQTQINVKRKKEEKNILKTIII